MPVLVVSPPLREQLGDRATGVLVDLFDQVSDQTKEDVITVVGERFERRLSEEIAGLRADLREEMARRQVELQKQIVELGAELRQEMANQQVGLREEMANQRVELRGEMTNLREEMADLRAELREEMARLRTDLARGQTEMIRWMFLFWIGQLAAILAILFTFFRK